MPRENAYADYGGALSVAIRRLKYENCPHLARPLGSLLRQLCRERSIHADVVVPVPLHPRRLVERGYNQAALLAQHVAAELDAALVTRHLQRVVDTKTQADLLRDERHTNVAQAFAVTAPSAFIGRRVLLVDDVATTGSTLAACRSALLLAGARSVTSVVVAHTARS